MPARRLKDLLNAPLATALARGIVFASPFVLTVVGYAFYRWMDDKIAQSPSVIYVTSESAETKRRVTELEVQRGLDLQRANTDRAIWSEMRSDVKAVIATVNKMAGAMEVRTGVKITEVPSVPSQSVASTQ